MRDKSLFPLLAESLLLHVCVRIRWWCLDRTGTWGHHAPQCRAPCAPGDSGDCPAGPGPWWRQGRGQRAAGTWPASGRDVASRCLVRLDEATVSCWSQEGGTALQTLRAWLFPFHQGSCGTGSPFLVSVPWGQQPVGSPRR